LLGRIWTFVKQLTNVFANQHLTSGSVAILVYMQAFIFAPFFGFCFHYFAEMIGYGKNEFVDTRKKKCTSH